MTCWKQIMPSVYEGTPGQPDIGDDKKLLAKLSNMPLSTFKTHRLSTWQHHNDSHREAWPIILDWAAGTINHPFLTFLGNPGVGKTHLALALGWEWLEHGRTVLYYHVIGFLNALRDGYRQSGESDYEHIIAFAKNCSLLVLDDLGSEKVTDWADEQLDFICDFRYEHSKPLIVTSNLTLDDLPPRIADRLFEGQIILLKGDSFRRRKNEVRKTD